MKSALFAILLFGSIAFFLFNCKKLFKYLMQGKSENRFDNPAERIKNVFVIAFAQTKLLRDPVAGLLHIFIFWGFMLFIFAVIESMIQGFSPQFTFEFAGFFYSMITGVQDLFGALVIFAIIFSLYRRFIQKVKRLTGDKEAQFDAALILSLILLVVISMFGQNISLVAKHNFVLSENEFRPISSMLASSFYGNETGNSEIFFEIFWWMHLIVIFGFLNYLPYSKHLHVITSIPNVYFSKLKEKKNILKPINLEDESLEYYGADDVNRLNWKQLLDGYSCTECGRCASVCPAANSGKSLSPKKIITDIRERTIANGKALDAGGNPELQSKTLVHNYITDLELWECTTCNACVQECPVMIEHVDAIVDMRRHLVLTESNFPSELNNVFKSLEVNGTPWAFNQSDRAAWADGMNIKTMADDPNGEILFWVGCAGSYDARYKKATQAFSKLMQKAEIDFRILGAEETCNGDTARRLGNEYLAQEMVKMNVETLNRYNVKKIVTACPHCFNSLSKEFPQFGGNYEVVHHTEMIDELLSNGKIKLKDVPEKETITYHDSCYLGRYNDIYEEPRKSLSKIKGVSLVEMERNKSKGFCCGAGGGRMFLEDVEGERINFVRAEEAISTQAGTIGTACPFCMTMMSDGVKAHDKSEQVKVKDIAEIIYENSN